MPLELAQGPANRKQKVAVEAVAARNDVTQASAARGGGASEGGASRAAGRPRSVRDPGLAGGCACAAGRLCPHPCRLPSGASLGPPPCDGAPRSLSEQRVRAEPEAGGT